MGIASSADLVKGLECNGVIDGHRRVSRHIWDFDIARNPNVIKDYEDGERWVFIDIHAEAYHVNDRRYKIDKRSRYINGGRR